MLYLLVSVFAKITRPKHWSVDVGKCRTGLVFHHHYERYSEGDSGGQVGLRS